MFGGKTSNPAMRVGTSADSLASTGKKQRQSSSNALVKMTALQKQEQQQQQQKQKRENVGKKMSGGTVAISQNLALTDVGLGEMGEKKNLVFF